MGSRIVFRGLVFIRSPCPHGCNEVVSLKITTGEQHKNGECPKCKGKIHAFHFDDVVREGHVEQKN